MMDIEKDFLFPYTDIDDGEFVTIHKDCVSDYSQNQYCKYENLNLKTFNHTDYKMYDIENDIDPENHFYNTVNINCCEYYTEEQFNKNVDMEGALSILHFNSRSLYRNFVQIKDYVCQFNKFNVIAVSETWLDNEKVEDVELEGYKLFTINRVNKKGGGVALYVDTALRCKLIKSMSLTIENILECLTIEIEIERSKNIIISCVYRTSGTCIDTFINKIVDILEKKNENKIQIICGDFNIDLLNPKGHKRTTDFINTMYSTGLFPVITKPSRITTDTATLIDNIYTNEIEAEIVGGLFINDMTDHLPVFAIFQKLFTKINENGTNNYMMIRHRTPESIAALGEDLQKQNWSEVYENKDPNRAYNAFMNILTGQYEKHCLSKKIVKKRKNDDKPWITKGIEKACKKKNALYRKFIITRTKQAEDKYKTYKNKLISIIRFSKKDYYQQILERPEMMPGQYLHMPPPLPVKGLPVDEDDGRTLPSARQRRTPRWDLRMESMEGG
nr:uncharacterized protein LOC129443303 [Misgurnus anguillicaudatus]